MQNVEPCHRCQACQPTLLLGGVRCARVQQQPETLASINRSCQYNQTLLRSRSRCPYTPSQRSVFLTVHEFCDRASSQQQEPAITSSAETSQPSTTQPEVWLIESQTDISAQMRTVLRSFKNTVLSAVRFNLL